MPSKYYVPILLLFETISGAKLLLHRKYLDFYYNLVFKYQKAAGNRAVLARLMKSCHAANVTQTLEVSQKLEGRFSVLNFSWEELPNAKQRAVYMTGAHFINLATGDFFPLFTLEGGGRNTFFLNYTH